MKLLSQFVHSLRDCFSRWTKANRASYTAPFARDTSRPELAKGVRLMLTELPTEIIIAIAEKLQTCESRLLLSLSCRRIRDILTTNVELALTDKGSKRRFLQVYERDLEEHLTCRICVRLYKWRNPFARNGYKPHGCHERGVPHIERRNWICLEDTYFPVDREMIDLILKADELGQGYGLPVSALSLRPERRARHKKFWASHEARLVSGELLLLTDVTLNAPTWAEIKLQGVDLASMICAHAFRVLSPEGVLSSQHLTLPRIVRPGESGLLKCRYCRTQYSLSAYEDPLVSMIVAHLRVWKSFGSRYEDNRWNEQAFRRCSRDDLASDEVLHLNLRDKFGAVLQP